MTVGRDTPNLAEIAEVPKPSPAANTILARVTNPALIEVDRDQLSSVDRSSSAIRTAGVNSAMPQHDAIPALCKGTNDAQH